MLSELIPLLTPYDPTDLLASVAALQLMPENAGCTIRLEALAHAIAALPNESGRPQISASRLRSITGSDVFVKTGLSSYEDPFDNAFTEAFTFHGGSYIVFPGILEEPTFILRHLAQAIFLHSEPFPNDRFLDEARSLLIAILALSNEMSRRAGLGRGVKPHDIPRATILVPSAQRLHELKQAAYFTRTELIELLGDRGVYPHILDQLIISLGNVSSNSYTMDHGPLLVKPIVHTADRFVVALPGALLAAARNDIVRRAIEHHVHEPLAHRYNLAVWNTVVQSLDYIHSKPVSIDMPEPLNVPCLREGFFSLDTDKLIYVILATNSLLDYDVNDPLGPWPFEHVQKSIDSRIEQVEKHIVETLASPGGFLRLVLVESMGKWYGIGISEPVHPQSQALYFSAGALETIAVLEGGNRLVLWKYAKSFWEVRKHSEIAVYGALDEFHLYRERKYSYYVADDIKPSLISIMPGGVGSLRREVLEKRDWHGVPSWRENSIIEVTTLNDTKSIPIYVPLRNVDIHRQVTVFVEGLPLPVWIISPELREVEQAGLRREYFEFAETVAYWLWQFTPGLTPIVHIIASDYSRILIQVFLEPQATPQQLDDPEAGQGEEPIKVNTDPAASTIHIALGLSAGTLFETRDNRGDRELMRRILLGFRDLLNNEDRELLADDTIIYMIDAHAPLGLKKKLLALNVQDDPRLAPGNIPSFRGLQKADEQFLLDELGHYLREGEGYQIGHSFNDKSAITDVLHKSVGYFYRELCDLVSVLRGDELLGWLIAHHEALVQRQSFDALIIPTRIACYSSDTRIVSDLKEEYALTSSTALASRFLIEYVVTKPPSGSRLMSYDIYDRLLAFADLIIDFGFASDLVEFELADIKYAILPSGRLGTNQEQYNKSLNAFLEVITVGRIERSRREFVRRGDHRKGMADQQPDWVTGIDAAATVEFGFSITDLGILMMDAISIGHQINDGTAHLEINDLINRLTQTLGWTAEQIKRAIDLLSLTSRADFLNPPSPHGKTDVWPWRFNRSLSYLRRPFIQLERNGVVSVLWGIRHMSEAFRYLTQVCLDGRLKANSDEMKKVISELKNEATKAFNDQIADLFAQNRGLIVRRRVKKFVGVRIQDSAGDLGDIDVLVADPRRKQIQVIECKDVAGARAPHELANEIRGLLRGHKNKTSTVALHQKRTRWVRENLKVVLDSLGLPFSAKWKVSPLIIVSRELMTPHMQKSPIPIISLMELRRQIVR